MSSSLGKRPREDDAGGFDRLSALPGHISYRILQGMDFPLFPGPRRFSKVPWLAQLVSNITLDMKSVISKWRIEGLVIHAKHYEKVHLDWAAMGALIEIWHPQTHTFLFPTFEATILLEETEMLLGLKKSRKGLEDQVALMTEGRTGREILGTFISDPGALKGILTARGVNLAELARWVTAALARAKDDEEIELMMRGFAICLAGALLFPFADNLLEDGQLSAICGLWEGKRVGPAVLAYLYSGLTAASLGRPPFGSMLLFACWVDLHFKFDFGTEGSSVSRLYRNSPLYHISNVVCFNDRMINRMPSLKKRKDWRDHFSITARTNFTYAVPALQGKELRVRHCSGVDLRLIGATEIVLYNAHRCHSQIGLPRHEFALRSHLPAIKIRALGTDQDVEEVTSTAALWKTSVSRQISFQIEEDRDQWKCFVRSLKMIRRLD